METPPITFIKSNNDLKTERYHVEIKLCGNTTSDKLDRYGFKMALFDNDDPEKFLLFMKIFNFAIKYIRSLSYVESLSQFNALCIQIVSTTMTHLNQVILGLGT